MLGHHPHASKRPFQWHFAGGPMMARWICPPSSNYKKNDIKVGPPLTKVSGSAHCHCTYQRSQVQISKFSPLGLLFILVNSADPDNMPYLCHFIWFFTVCQITLSERFKKSTQITNTRLPKQCVGLWENIYIAIISGQPCIYTGLLILELSRRYLFPRIQLNQIKVTGLATKHYFIQRNYCCFISI